MFKDGHLKSHLFKVSLHGLVGQQQDRPHQVSHQDEVPLGLQVEGHDVVVVVALGPQLFLGRPLVQSHLKQMVVTGVFTFCFRCCCRVGLQRLVASFQQLLGLLHEGLTEVQTLLLHAAVTLNKTALGERISGALSR